MISEVFCEVEFEDAEAARLQRKQRIKELQAQGMACTVENLYRVDGKRVYLLTAEIISSQGQKGEYHSPQLKARNSRQTRSKPKFETR
jgi:hypothetical protein